MSQLTGQLNIRLRPADSGWRVAIDSTRRVAAAEAFIGQRPATVAATLPRLYGICARAQAAACAGALEAALGYRPAPGLEHRRALVVATETAREHLWRILLDWPRLSGEAPQAAVFAELLGAVRTFHRALDPDGRLFQPGAEPAPPDAGTARASAAHLARQAVQALGDPPARWLERLATEEDFARWLDRAKTPATALLGELVRAGETALGGCAVTALPPWEPGELAERLRGPHWRAFVAAPEWRGEVRETTALTRQAAHPLLGALLARHGNGLLVRCVAPLIELAAALRWADADWPHGDYPDAPLAGLAGTPLAPGLGLGSVEAARGRLAHLARVEDDRVMEYRILAPTEWNFHPRGVLAQALASLPLAPPERARRWAERLIVAVDPCVEYRLEIVEAAAPTFD